MRATEEQRSSYDCVQNSTLPNLDSPNSDVLKCSDGFIELDFVVSAGPILGRYFGVDISSVIKPSYLNKQLFDAIFGSDGVCLGAKSEGAKFGLANQYDGEDDNLSDILRLSLSKLSPLGYPFRGTLKTSKSNEETGISVVHDNTALMVPKFAVEVELELAELKFIGPSPCRESRFALVKEVRRLASNFPDIFPIVVGSLAIGVEGHCSDADITLICPGRDARDVLRLMCSEAQVDSDHD